MEVGVIDGGIQSRLVAGCIAVGFSAPRVTSHSASAQPVHAATADPIENVREKSAVRIVEEAEVSPE
jgi:hypothetical protein